MELKTAKWGILEKVTLDLSQRRLQGLRLLATKDMVSALLKFTCIKIVSNSLTAVSGTQRRFPPKCIKNTFFRLSRVLLDL